MPDDEDPDFQYPLEELGAFFGLSPQELKTEYAKGNLELHLVAGKLKGTKRQAREMLERCRVRKSHPASNSSPEIAVVKACGSSKTERSAKVRAAFNQTVEELKKPLPRYLAGKFEAPQGVRPTELLIGEVVTAYLKEHAAHSPYLGTRRFLAKTATSIMDWWTDKTWAEVNAPNCRKYVTWRRARLKRNGKQVSDQTVRHELTTLQSALSWYSREYAPLVVVPKVTRPPPTPPKLDYFLERDDVAARIRAARRLGYDRIVRLLLVCAYTGTRPGATMALRWLPSPSDGWVDLEGCILWRKGTRALESKKRRTPCRIHTRLLRHLKHWRDADMTAGITHIINSVVSQRYSNKLNWLGDIGSSEVCDRCERS
jgi:hypothetical protein